MSITNALSNAYSGLAATSRRAEVTSHNIANANTPGYVRREVELSAAVTGDRGDGVRVSTVKRAQDEAVTADRRTADSIAGREAAIADGARQIADAVGGPDDPGALFERFEALETGLRGLADNPQSITVQENTVTAARALATAFNDISSEISETRTLADQAIGRDVETVNASLVEIETLNSNIQSATAGQRDTTALEQRRDDAINRISEIIPVKVLNRNGGSVALTTDSGATLIDGKARQIEFTPSVFVGTGDDYRAGTTGLSGLTLGTTDITPGGPGVVQGLTGGRLAGLFEVRDGVGVESQAQIDALAADVIGRFESGTIPPAAGQAGLFTDGGNPLDPADQRGLASRIQINAAVDPAQGGDVFRIRDGLGAAAPGPTADNSFALQLLDAATDIAPPATGTGLTAPATAAGAAADLGTLFESRAQRAETAQSTATGRREALASAELEASGVDLDKELQDLLQIENAYAANAKVMQTVDQMMQRLLEI